MTPSNILFLNPSPQPRRGRLFMQAFALLIALMTTMSSAWAVFARQDGNVLRFQSEGYKAMGGQTVNISLGGETKTVTTGKNGEVCIVREEHATAADRNTPYCAIFSGSGEGRITGDNFNMGFTLNPDGGLSVSPSQKMSNVELIGIGFGGLGLIYLATDDDDDDGGVSNGGGSNTGGGTGTGGGTSPGVDYSICLGMSTGLFNLIDTQGGCPNAAGGTHNCNLVFLGGPKGLECGSNTGRVVGDLGPQTGGKYNAEGRGQYSGASNARFMYNLQFNVNGGMCSANGTMEVDNLLGPNESCVYGVQLRYSGP